jgi:predicted RNA binding protein YcfA (HicA-like mRNA interferase family)
MVLPKEMVAALKRAGFVEHHQVGSHMYLWHAEKKLMTMVAMHPRDLSRPIMKKILKQASLSEDEFRELI